MNKPLSAQLEEVEPVELPSGKFVHRAEYEKMRQVAILLAGACEKATYYSKEDIEMNKTDYIVFMEQIQNYSTKAIAKAADILGEK